MELRTVDPRDLKDNPDNPRRTTAPRHADDQLAASVKAIGLIQPPIVTEREGELVIVAGHRRVRAAIAAGLERIGVLLNGGDPSGMMALSENVVRAQLGPVDQWRGIERLEAMGWNEEGIATALALPVRTVRKLKLLAHVHKPMLERMAAGEMPREEELRVIAAASRAEQAQVWKRHRPRKGEAVGWHAIRRALEKHRFWAKAARFDQAAAEAFGILWEDDLFAPADEDTRYTTQADAFLAAQRAWLLANLPPNGVLLEEDAYGQARLPPRAQRVWGEPGSSDTIGHYIAPATGEIGTIAYRLPEGRRDKAGGRTTTPARLRPEITKRGSEIIGELRTTALHQALREAPVSDDMLLAMLVVAFAGHNVQVQSGSGRTAYGSACPAIATELTAGGALSENPELVRACARAMLTEALSCRTGPSDSGHVARLAGVAVGADDFLPCMANEEFLGCLSRQALNEAARACGLVPHKKARDTRSAISSQFRNGTFVHPAARFALTEDERAAVARNEPGAPAWPDEGDALEAAEEPAEPGEEDAEAASMAEGDDLDSAV